MERINTISWKFIDKYFENDHLALINHHISSYNDFFTDSLNSNKNIQRIFRDTNPIKIRKNKEKKYSIFVNEITYALAENLCVRTQSQETYCSVLAN